MIIKSVVTSLFNHVMSCYRLPKAVTKKLTSAVALEECIGSHETNYVLTKRKVVWILKIW